jgi:tetratricopeptide (TPR) repeat protein
VALAGFAVFLFTLNHWVSLYSLGTVARLCGWSWRPELDQPLHTICFLPLKLAPVTWIPLLSNLLTALFAALVLGLLARSVALLPHDQPPERRFGPPRPAAPLTQPGSWVPPVVAAILCGLQLSFWEHATSATGEMLDLLVQAAVIWCLLEYRASRREPWLARAVLIYAAGMTDDWALAGYLPVFVGALIWLKGYGSFLERRFLGRMLLCAAAGCSLYLLLPAVQSFSGHSSPGFVDTVILHIKGQKLALGCLHKPAFRSLALASLVPLLVISIPWKSHTVSSSDDSRLGVFLTKATVHTLQFLCLGFSIWIALDPGFSPRNLDLGTPMLGHYYVWSLAAGFCAGHFLVFGLRATRGPGRQVTMLPALSVFLMCAVGVALLCRNLGQVRAANGPRLREFARQLHDDLPAGKCVALSEDSRLLLLLQAETASRSDGKDPLLIDASSLALPDYQAFLERQAGARWPLPALTNRVEFIGPGRLLRLLSEFASREPVVYLHPATGFFFETFISEPRGLVHLLARRPIATSEKPALQAQPLDANELLWQTRWTQLLAALSDDTRELPARKVAWPGVVLGWLQLERQQTFNSSFLGARYARALDDWGVELQRAGRWTAAGAWFQRALDLNPSSIPAHINALYNERHSQGDQARLVPATVQSDLSSLFFKYSSWRAVLDADGPVDEPSYLFRTARVSLARGEHFQALTGFARCMELATNWAAPILWRAEAFLELGGFEQALALAEKSVPMVPPDNSADLSQLLHCRTLALAGLKRTNDAVATIESFVSQYPRQEAILGTAADLYEYLTRFEAELAVLDQLLQSDPGRPGFLARKGFAELHLERFDAAVNTLTQALEKAPADDNSRLCRGVANLGAGRLDAARPDFEQLLGSPTLAPQACFGLGTIAWQNHDTNATLLYYRRYLSNRPPGARQAKVAAERVREFGGQGER